MSDTRTWKRYGGAAGLVASGLIAGGVLAGTLTANAAEDTTAGTGDPTSRSAEGTRPEHRAEEALTGDVQSQVEAAVLAEYPGATIERTETDSGGVYEAHIVTADGERRTVLVGEDFTVTGTETGGRGRGGAQCDEDAAPGAGRSGAEQPADGGATGEGEPTS